MTHLTEEQFERIMQSGQTQDTHLGSCQLCRSQLAEKRALAARLKNAFANVSAGGELADRIRDSLPADTSPARARLASRIFDIRAHRRRWAVAASAVAAMVVVAPIVIYLLTPSPAVAAQKALVKIHQHNLSQHNDFFTEAQPEKLADYFREKLGFNPRLPTPGHGLALRGCCVRHFKGAIVGSYVVDTPQGVMSIVIVTDRPETLGMSTQFAHGSDIFWKSYFAKCSMVSTRIGQYTYCAVGEISHRYLTELLARLLVADEADTANR